MAYKFFLVLTVLFVLSQQITVGTCETYSDDGLSCQVCVSNHHLYEGSCYIDILGCKQYNFGNICHQCLNNYILVNNLCCDAVCMQKIFSKFNQKVIKQTILNNTQILKELIPFVQAIFIKNNTARLVALQTQDDFDTRRFAFLYEFYQDQEYTSKRLIIDYQLKTKTFIPIDWAQVKDSPAYGYIDWSEVKNQTEVQSILSLFPAIYTQQPKNVQIKAANLSEVTQYNITTQDGGVSDTKVMYIHQNNIVILAETVQSGNNDENVHVKNVDKVVYTVEPSEEPTLESTDETTEETTAQDITFTPYTKTITGEQIAAEILINEPLKQSINLIQSVPGSNYTLTIIKQSSKIFGLINFIIISENKYTIRRYVISYSNLTSKVQITDQNEQPKLQETPNIPQNQSGNYTIQDEDQLNTVFFQDNIPENMTKIVNQTKIIVLNNTNSQTTTSTNQNSLSDPVFRRMVITTPIIGAIMLEVVVIFSNPSLSPYAQTFYYWLYNTTDNSFLYSGTINKVQTPQIYANPLSYSLMYSDSSILNYPFSGSDGNYFNNSNIKWALQKYLITHGVYDENIWSRVLPSTQKNRNLIGLKRLTIKFGDQVNGMILIAYFDIAANVIVSRQQTIYGNTKEGNVVNNTSPIVQQQNQNYTVQDEESQKFFFFENIIPENMTKIVNQTKIIVLNNTDSQANTSTNQTSLIVPVFRRMVVTSPIPRAIILEVAVVFSNPSLSPYAQTFYYWLYNTTDSSFVYSGTIQKVQTPQIYSNPLAFSLAESDSSIYNYPFSGSFGNYFNDSAFSGALREYLINNGKYDATVWNQVLATTQKNRNLIGLRRLTIKFGDSIKGTALVAYFSVSSKTVIWRQQITYDYTVTGNAVNNTSTVKQSTTLQQPTTHQNPLIFSKVFVVKQGSSVNTFYPAPLSNQMSTLMNTLNLAIKSQQKQTASIIAPQNPNTSFRRMILTTVIQNANKYEVALVYSNALIHKYAETFYYFIVDTATNSSILCGSLLKVQTAQVYNNPWAYKLQQSDPSVFNYPFKTNEGNYFAQQSIKTALLSVLSQKVQYPLDLWENSRIQSQKDRFLVNYKRIRIDFGNQTNGVSALAIYNIADKNIYFDQLSPYNEKTISQQNKYTQTGIATEVTGSTVVITNDVTNLVKEDKVLNQILKIIEQKIPIVEKYNLQTVQISEYENTLEYQVQYVNQQRSTIYITVVHDKQTHQNTVVSSQINEPAPQSQPVINNPLLKIQNGFVDIGPIFVNVTSGTNFTVNKANQSSPEIQTNQAQTTQTGQTSPEIQTTQSSTGPQAGQTSPMTEDCVKDCLEVPPLVTIQQRTQQIVDYTLQQLVLVYDFLDPKINQILSNVDNQTGIIKLNIIVQNNSQQVQNFSTIVIAKLQSQQDPIIQQVKPISEQVAKTINQLIVSPTQQPNSDTVLPPPKCNLTANIEGVQICQSQTSSAEIDVITTAHIASLPSDQAVQIVKEQTILQSATTLDGQVIKTEIYPKNDSIANETEQVLTLIKDTYQQEARQEAQQEVQQEVQQEAQQGPQAQAQEVSQTYVVKVIMIQQSATAVSIHYAMTVKFSYQTDFILKRYFYVRSVDTNALFYLGSQDLPYDFDATLVQNRYFTVLQILEDNAQTQNIYEGIIQATKDQVGVALNKSDIESISYRTYPYGYYLSAYVSTSTFIGVSHLIEIQNQYTTLRWTQKLKQSTISSHNNSQNSNPITPNLEHQSTENTQNKQSTPNDQTPNSQATNSQTSNSSTPNSSTPNSSTPNSSTADSSTSNSQTPNSSTPNTSTPNSSTADSSTPNSSAPNSQTPNSPTQSSGPSLPNSGSLVNDTTKVVTQVDAVKEMQSLQKISPDQLVINPSIESQLAQVLKYLSVEKPELTNSSLQQYATTLSPGSIRFDLYFVKFVTQTFVIEYITSVSRNTQDLSIRVILFKFNQIDLGAQVSIVSTANNQTDANSSNNATSPKNNQTSPSNNSTSSQHNSTSSQHNSNTPSNSSGNSQSSNFSNTSQSNVKNQQFGYFPVDPNQIYYGQAIKLINEDPRNATDVKLDLSNTDSTIDDVIRYIRANYMIVFDSGVLTIINIVSNSSLVDKYVVYFYKESTPTNPTYQIYKATINRNHTTKQTTYNVQEFILYAQHHQLVVQNTAIQAIQPTDSNAQDTDIAYGYKEVEISTITSNPNLRNVISYIELKYGPVVLNKTILKIEQLELCDGRVNYKIIYAVNNSKDKSAQFKFVVFYQPSLNKVLVLNTINLPQNSQYSQLSVQQQQSDTLLKSVTAYVSGLHPQDLGSLNAFTVKSANKKSSALSSSSAGAATQYQLILSSQTSNKKFRSFVVVASNQIDMKQISFGQIVQVSLDHYRLDQFDQIFIMNYQKLDYDQLHTSSNFRMVLSYLYNTKPTLNTSSLLGAAFKPYSLGFLYKLYFIMNNSKIISAELYIQSFSDKVTLKTYSNADFNTNFNTLSPSSPIAQQIVHLIKAKSSSLQLSSVSGVSSKDFLYGTLYKLQFTINNATQQYLAYHDHSTQQINIVLSRTVSNSGSLLAVNDCLQDNDDIQNLECVVCKQGSQLLNGYCVILSSCGALCQKITL